MTFDRSGIPWWRNRLAAMLLFYVGFLLTSPAHPPHVRWTGMAAFAGAVLVGLAAIGHAVMRLAGRSRERQA